MGMGLIVPSLPGVTKSLVLFGLSGLSGRGGVFQERAPAPRPYPKPTQVDW
jgi:hypothetical protein